MQAISLVTVAAILLGGLVAAPLAAWLVRHMPPRILGVAVAGIVILTNAPRALDSVALSGPVESVALASLALAWGAAFLVVVRRRGTRLAS